ncbi:MAG: DUF3488 and transglutaminase-like domain-containing protein [Polyangiaceae bacterium]|nr:DUF3488 and transglutaminase-like domain-containing protein [Polyangiaceae bacterium]
MRFGLVHRILTNAFAALSIVALVSTASMPPWKAGLLLVALAVAIAVPERWRRRPVLRYFATIGPLILVTVQLARFFAGYPPLDIAIEFAVILQIIRLLTRRGAAHDQQLIVLALLHFVAGTVLGGGFVYGLCFLGFLVVAPGALALSHLRREVEGNYRQGARDRTGLPVDVPRILRSRRVVGKRFLALSCLASIPIFLFTLALFMMFPRVNLSLPFFIQSRPGRVIGFSDRVDLGTMGLLRADPTIALRFYVPDLPEPHPSRLILRLRGTAFDKYDGHAWSRPPAAPHQSGLQSGEPDEMFALARPPDEHDRKISFDLESIDPPVVFLPPHVVALKLHPQQTAVSERSILKRGPEGEVRYSDGESHGIRYDAYVASESEPIIETVAAEDRQRYLDIPASMPSRIADLAREWTAAQPTPYLKAKAIEERLKHTYTYDIGSPSSGRMRPVDHFLFESKRGHCEFFSTAMAILLREIGIPSRNVTGFVGGTYNRFGRYYSVRQGDAHSWVEAYFDDPAQGWVTFDPTPTSGAQPLEDTTGTYAYLRDFVEALSERWSRYIVGYDLKTQIHFFDDFRRHYEKLRTITHINNINFGAAEHVTRDSLVGATLLALMLGGFLFWKRKTRAKPTASMKRILAINPGHETISVLYKRLELALNHHGLSRPPCVPPLRFAEQLARSAHPLSDSVLALTQRYIEARFGGVAMNAAARRDFEQQIKRVRAYRAPSAPPPSRPLSSCRERQP